MDNIDPSIDASSDDYSSDSDIELIRSLRANADTKDCVKKFKATRDRIRTRKTAGLPFSTSLCQECRKITIPILRKYGFQFQYDFPGLRKSAAFCPFCNLVLMALRRQLLKIDSQLHSSVLGYKVKYNDDGVSDYELQHQRNKSGRRNTSERFTLSMGETSDGIIRLDAQIFKNANTESNMPWMPNQIIQSPALKTAESRPLIHIKNSIMVFANRGKRSSESITLV